MTIESTILLSNVSTESSDSNFSYGEKKKGAGYHRLDDGVHTATFIFDNFSGTVKIQGTLNLYPGLNDWVDIEDTTIGGDSSSIDPTKIVTFIGKFIWLRVAYNIQSGTIQEIRYNY
jgi:hypothetical protein